MKELRRTMLRENRIYILPTSRGFLFLAAVVVLILTAATYNNNLIFILAFFLFAVFVVSMLQTHYNLKGVRLQYVGSEEVFQDDHMGLMFYLTQKRARIKKAIKIRLRSKTFKTLISPLEDLDPKDQLKPARIDVLAWRRGVHALPEVILETEYPLGLFRAWKVFRPEAKLLIYPRPVATHVLAPRARESGEDDQGMRGSPDGDFGELKEYATGESYHQIAWKHYARTGDLYTKVHWGAEDRHYVIPWNPPAKDFENYLMLMSGWVKRAVDENASFEMATPHGTVEPGRGFDHGRACWRALALVQGAR